MFGRKKDAGSRREKIDTLLGEHTTVDGDIRVNGGIHVEGVIKGNVYSESGKSVLIVGETGHIHGDVRVSNLVLNGSIDGDVFASKVELFDKGRINGDIFYDLLELAVGAEVNGKLVREELSDAPFKLSDSEAAAKPAKKSV